MNNPNTHLDLINQQLKLMQHIYDSIKTEHNINVAQDRRLSDHDCRITANEESINQLASKFQQFEYFRGRNEELEFLQNPYSQDGDANCNS